MTNNNTSILNETTMFEYSDAFPFDFLEHNGLSEQFREILKKLLKVIGIEHFDEQKFDMRMLIKDVKAPNRRYTPEKCYLQYSLTKPTNYFLYGRVDWNEVITIVCTQEEEKQVRELLLKLYNMANHYSHNNVLPAQTIEYYKNIYNEPEKSVFAELAKDLEVPETTQFDRIDEHGVLYPCTEYCTEYSECELEKFENKLNDSKKENDARFIKVYEYHVNKTKGELSYFQSLKQYKNL